MNNEEFKNWMDNNCFVKRKTKSINNYISTPEWWSNRNFIKEFNYVNNYKLNFECNKFIIKLWHIYNNKLNKDKCIVCNRDSNFNSFKEGYWQHCSIQCTYKSEQRKHNISKNNNYVDIMIKLKNTNKNKYGVDSYFSTKEFKEKSKQTKIIRYNDCNFNNKEKNKSTCIEKYSVDHFDKLKTQHLNIEQIVKMHYEDKMSCVEIADKLNVSATTITKRLHDNGYKPFIQIISTYEKEICAFLNELDIEYETSNRKILEGKELDIYCDKYKVAIELNGLYWHSYDEKETKDEIYRHYNKYEQCKVLGIKLLTITDYEWNNKKEIVKSIIRSVFNIPLRKIRASKCKIITLDEKDYRKFLNDNHIQGYVKANEKLGLIYNNELVSVMSIDKSRYTNNKYELIRFCNKLNTIVYGSASKLFNCIRHNKNDIISYCSIDLFDGKLYNTLGFKYERITKPNYFYVKNGNVIISRVNTQKHKLQKLLYNFDNSFTEYQNMFNNGYRRYWNCGNSVWIYN